MEAYETERRTQEKKKKTQVKKNAGPQLAVSSTKPEHAQKRNKRKLRAYKEKIARTRQEGKPLRANGCTTTQLKLSFPKRARVFAPAATAEKEKRAKEMANITDVCSVYSPPSRSAAAPPEGGTGGGKRDAARRRSRNRQQVLWTRDQSMGIFWPPADQIHSTMLVNWGKGRKKERRKHESSSSSCRSP